MAIQLAETKLSDYGFWDRIRIFFLPERTKYFAHGYGFYTYKIYKYRKVITYEGRRH